VSLRGGREFRAGAAARNVVQRFSYLAFVMAALALLAFARSQAPLVERLRAGAIDVLAPALEIASRPVEAANRAAAEAQRLWFTYEENARLRADLERLGQWQVVARRLEQENAALRAQLNLRMEPQPTYVSARVIADGGSPFVRTVLLNAGRRDGVEKGQAAVTGAGLAGRVIELGERSSRLLLLTDLNSRVPVTVEGSRWRAILAGDNSARPRLLFLPNTAEVSVGDRVVTSGDGGVAPPGIPVGVVAQLGESEIRVQPFVEWDRLEYLSVVRFDLPRLSTSRQPASAPLPGGPR
jgi:rod shape-determining protein MreC